MNGFKTLAAALLAGLVMASPAQAESPAFCSSAAC